MARIVCQVLHKRNRVTVVWSEGKKTFPPYHLEGVARDRLYEASEQSTQNLGQLAHNPFESGQQLFQAFFSSAADQTEPGVNDILAWFRNRTQSQEFVDLLIASDDPLKIPFHAFIDPQGPREPWGERFSLAQIHRVNPLLGVQLPKTLSVLVAVDDTLWSRADESARAEFRPWRSEERSVTSKSELAKQILAASPDLLVLVGSANRGELTLDGEAISPQEIAAWVKGAQDGSPDPLIFLATPDGPTDSWRNILRSFSNELFGVLANQTSLPVDETLKLAADFLKTLTRGESSLGETVRELRRRHGAMASSLVSLAPGHLTANDTLAAPLADYNITPMAFPLPESPFLPLRPFTAEEQPLFYGRDDETLHCCLLVDRAGSSGLMLTGSASVGKTSLLQAGILPKLARESIGFQLVCDREEDAEGKNLDTAIRPARDLVSQLAASVATFCARSWDYTTPTDVEVKVDLPAILARTLREDPRVTTAIQAEPNLATRAGEAPPPLAKTDVESVWRFLKENPDALFGICEAIAKHLPFELVLAIDHGEDLFTARDSSRVDGSTWKILSQLVDARFPWKTIFAVRSDFLAAFRQRAATTGFGWEEYLVLTPAKNTLTEFLLLPTQQGEIPKTDDIPRQKYQYVLPTDVADTIVTRVLENAGAEKIPPLSLFHVVGQQLLERVRLAGKRGAIELDDLKRVGKFSEALLNYVETGLRQLPLTGSDREGIRRLLPNMIASGPDGSPVPRIIPARKLKEQWTAPGSPEAAVNSATERLNLFQIEPLYEDGNQELFVSLSQSALANVQAKQEKKKIASAATADVLWLAVPIGFFCVALTFAGMSMYYRNTPAAEREEKPATQIEEFKAQIRKQRELLQPREYRLQLALAETAWAAGNALNARQALVAEPAFGKDPKSMRGFEWHYLWNKIHPEKWNFQGHAGAITSLAVTPDGKLAASASVDGAVKIWSLTTGLILAQTPKSDKEIQAIAFSADGKKLATAGNDRTIRFWDVEKLDAASDAYVDLAKPAFESPAQPQTLSSLWYGPKALFAGSIDGTIKTFDPESGKEKEKFSANGSAVLTLALSPDGKTLVSAGADGKIHLWDWASGKEALAIDTPWAAVLCLAIDPEGKTLVAGGIENQPGVELGTVRRWKLGEKAEDKWEAPIQHSQGVFGIAFSPDGKVIATGGKDHHVYLWDASTGKKAETIHAHYGWVRAVAFAKSTNLLLSGSFDQMVKAWPVGAGKASDVLSGHADWVQAVAFGPKNQLLASGSKDGTVKLWDPKAGKLLATLPSFDGSISALAFSSHQKDPPLLGVAISRVKAASEVKLLELTLDTKEGVKSKETKSLKGHPGGVNGIAFHPKVPILATAGADNTAILWDLEEGKGVHLLKHLFEVRSISFSKGGETVFTGSRDGSVRVFDVASGGEDPSLQFRPHASSIEAIRFFILGKQPTFLTAARDHQLRMFVYASPKEKENPEAVREVRPTVIHTLRSHNQPVADVLVVEPMPTSRLPATTIVSASWDHTIKFWDADENELHTLVGHTGPVRALAMSTDQTILASASHDRTIRLWRAPTMVAPPEAKKK